MSPSSGTTPLSTPCPIDPLPRCVDAMVKHFTRREFFTLTGGLRCLVVHCDRPVGDAAGDLSHDFRRSIPVCMRCAQVKLDGSRKIRAHLMMRRIHRPTFLACEEDSEDN